MVNVQAPRWWPNSGPGHEAVVPVSEYVCRWDYYSCKNVLIHESRFPIVLTSIFRYAHAAPVDFTRTSANIYLEIWSSRKEDGRVGKTQLLLCFQEQGEHSFLPELGKQLSLRAPPAPESWWFESSPSCFSLL